MRIEIRNQGDDYISGVYVAEGNEQQPQCTWCFDHNTGEIRDLVDTASVVIGYANSDEEALNFLGK